MLFGLYVVSLNTVIMFSITTKGMQSGYLRKLLIIEKSCRLKRKEIRLLLLYRGRLILDLKCFQTGDFTLIIKIEDLVTCLRISKDLYDLGVRQDTLFKWHEVETFENVILHKLQASKNLECYLDIDQNDVLIVKNIYAAYTISELAVMLKKIKGPTYGTYYKFQYSDLDPDNYAGELKYFLEKGIIKVEEL